MTKGGDSVVTEFRAYTGEMVHVYTWLARKYAIRMEDRGLNHSSGRSIKAFCRQLLDLDPKAGSEEIVAAIEERITQILEGEKES
jgi:hypothetical protein